MAICRESESADVHVLQVQSRQERSAARSSSSSRRHRGPRITSATMSLYEVVTARHVPGVRLAERPIPRRKPATDGNVKSDYSDDSYGGKGAAIQEETATLHASDVNDDVLAECNVIIHDERPRTSPFSVTAQVSMRTMDAVVKLLVSDSGATKHMFHHRDQFTKYRLVTGQFVLVANGELIPVIGVGDVGPLRNVLHVQELVYDLVFESAFDKAGK